jgi:hypothetical protein
MPTSEAKIEANRQNSAKSTGPKTVEGKEKSRQNAYKHGLTGAGVVMPDEDAVEVERRLVAFRKELQPSGEIGEALVRRAAFLSVRLDQCMEHDMASQADRVRQAEADFEAPEGANPASIALLKAEAKAIARFDPSKEATMVRKYESATERGFYRVMKELRDLKKQAKAAENPEGSEELEQMLASFSQFQNVRAAFEPSSVETYPRTPANPPKPSELAPVGPAPSHFEVPITIGRRC